MCKCNLGSATIDHTKNQSDLHEVGCADWYSEADQNKQKLGYFYVYW